MRGILLDDVAEEGKEVEVEVWVEEDEEGIGAELELEVLNMDGISILSVRTPWRLLLCTFFALSISFSCLLMSNFSSNFLLSVSLFKEYRLDDRT